jgi:hypothetical protein
MYCVSLLHISHTGFGIITCTDVELSIFVYTSVLFTVLFPLETMARFYFWPILVYSGIKGNIRLSTRPGYFTRLH